MEPQTPSSTKRRGSGHMEAGTSACLLNPCYDLGTLSETSGLLQLAMSPSLTFCPSALRAHLSFGRGPRSGDSSLEDMVEQEALIEADCNLGRSETRASGVVRTMAQAKQIR